MPVTSNLTNGSDQLATNIDGSASQFNLVYFIVSLVIQTEYASNGNKNLTQKQITELFNIGCSIKQMYDLTVSAGFADVETFLSSIPFAYAPVSSSLSIFDEILSCEIPNIISYIQLIQYVNTPGPKCWGFGSIDIVIASIKSANDATSSIFELGAIDYSDSSGINGNSLYSLWQLFNANNDLPENSISAINDNKLVSNITLANVSKSVDNFIKLNTLYDLLNDNTVNYTTLVITANIPVEVILCVKPNNLVTSNEADICSEMNNVWNFITNNSTGTSSVSRSDVNMVDVLSSGLDFSTALGWLSDMGYTLPQVLNNDTKKNVSDFGNAVSSVVVLIVATPSLYENVVTVFSNVYNDTESVEYYLYSLSKTYNTAIVTVKNMNGKNTSNYTPLVFTKATSSIPASLSSSYGVGTTLNSMFPSTSRTITQENAYNTLVRLQKLIQLITDSNDTTYAKFAFRVSLNGYYPVSNLLLSNISHFLHGDDKTTTIMNLLNDSANMSAIVSNSLPTGVPVMTESNLSLFNKFMAVGKSGIVAIPVNDLTKTIKFDFATFESLSISDELIEGDGDNFPGSPSGSTFAVRMENAISRAYGVDTNSKLVSKVNGLADYSKAGVIGNLTTTKDGVKNIDEILFTTASARVVRMLAAYPDPSSSDYESMATVVGKIIAYGYNLDAINDGNNANNMKQNLGGNIVTAVAAYGVLGCTKSDLADFINWLYNNDGNTPNATKTNIISKMLEIGNTRTVDFGSKLLNTINTPSNNTIITNVISLVNTWADKVVTLVDGIPSFKQYDIVNSIITAFFSLSGLNTNDVQDQILIKKLARFYNNVSNDVITIVYANNMLLGLWAQYVDIKFLCYTDGVNNVSNYNVDEILNVAQQLSIFDFSSGRSTGIINIALITAESLVLNGIITIDQLPSYIAYTSGSGTTMSTSQENNLRLILAVCKAMDQASASKTYSQNLESILQRSVTYVAVGSGYSDPANPTNPTSDALSLTEAQDLRANWMGSSAKVNVADIKATVTGFSGMDENKVKAVINYVLEQFNADGSPRIAVQYNPYN